MFLAPEKTYMKMKKDKLAAVKIIPQRDEVRGGSNKLIFQGTRLQDWTTICL